MIMVRNFTLNDFDSPKAISTKGATDCSYYEAFHDDFGDVFIKIGEKVSNEIRNYEILNSLNCPSVLPLIGTLGKDGIILPRVSDPVLGYNAVDLLWEYPESFPNFLSFQKESLNVLLAVHLSQEPEGSNISSMFGQRINERFDALVGIKDNVIQISAKESVQLSHLLFDGVPFQSAEGRITLPSINSMIETLLPLLSEEFPWRPVTIHADPQTSNFIGHNQKVVLADLSDIRRSEDVAWDIAKWVNYVGRFHQIVKERASLSNSADPSALNISDTTIYQIRTEAISQIAHSLPHTSEDSLYIRATAGEFVVNLSTLKRHITRFPLSSPYVIQAIGHSFLCAHELIKK